MPTAKLYLPKTADNYTAVLESVKRRVSDAYGGFTAYDGSGGWVDGSGELVEEPVTIVETSADSRTFGADMDAFMRELALDVKDATGESTIMVVRDGDKWLA